jgi:hypothetical protein
VPEQKPLLLGEGFVVNPDSDLIKLFEESGLDLLLEGSGNGFIRGNFQGLKKVRGKLVCCFEICFSSEVSVMENVYWNFRVSILTGFFPVYP